MTSATLRLVVDREPVDGAAAREILREYFTELVARYQQRPATEADVDAAIVDEPSTDLVPPRGAFLLARDAGAVLGCAGVRVLDVRSCELKRMFVRPAGRRRGVGRALIAFAERVAAELGAERLLLDTRADLVEARSLYASSGFIEIPKYNDGPYADHWFAKDLRA